MDNNLTSFLSDSYIRVCSTILNGIRSHYTDIYHTNFTNDSFIDKMTSEILFQNKSEISDNYKLTCKNVIESIKNHISSNANTNITDEDIPVILKDIYNKQK